MLSKSRESNPTIVRWIPFFGGFLIGIVFVLMMGRYFLEQQGIMGIGSLQELKYLTISKERLLLYVLETRWKIVIAMIFLSVTMIGRLFRIACTLWYGFSFGTMLMAGCMTYRFQGLWLVFLSQFPHMLLYVPAYIQLCEISRILYQCTQNSNRSISGKDIGSGMFRVAVLVMTGCLMESYINPVIIMKMLKKF